MTRAESTLIAPTGTPVEHRRVCTIVRDELRDGRTPERAHRVRRRALCALALACGAIAACNRRAPQCAPTQSDATRTTREVYPTVPRAALRAPAPPTATLEQQNACTPAAAAGLDPGAGVVVLPPGTSRTDEARCRVPAARGGGPRASTSVAGSLRELGGAFVERLLENGCRYRASVRGGFREYGPTAGTPARDTPQLAPEFRVTSAVRCADAATEQPERLIAGTPEPTSQTRGALESAATVWTSREGMRCVYTPSIELTPWLVRVRDVSFACRATDSGRLVSGRALDPTRGAAP